MKVLTADTIMSSPETLLVSLRLKGSHGEDVASAEELLRVCIGVSCASLAWPWWISQLSGGGFCAGIRMQ